MPEHAPHELHESAGESDHGPATRRTFLLASLGLFLTGCSGGQRTAQTLPSPAWDAQPTPALPPGGEVISPPARPAPQPLTPPTLAGVLPRSRWAAGRPVPNLMNRMLPVRYLTVHHDGMRPFYGNSVRDAAGRLEAIRRSHRGRGWGDIGYHFAIDRAGNVWEGRPLAYQGAHVKNYNEYNLGVLCLGNFDEQQPTQAQIASLNTFVNRLLRTYGVPVAKLRTHQEWAPTACPGRSVQRYMVSARASGAFG
jgi:hypothetical protein